MQADVLDVLVVGAGISGISAGVHLQQRCPDHRFEILEARERLGGTWDLFRYPGVRSDSDMHTLGFRFKPWTERQAIARGPAIWNYLDETVREHGLDRHIRYGQRLIRATWSTAQSCWILSVGQVADGTEREMRARFLFLCCGYYRYDQGYLPDYPGQQDYRGRLIHPQHWPAQLDCRGKQVVVIGSGATAATLVPALAAEGAHVTMLQRSPSWYFSVPAEDPGARLLRAVLPQRAALALVRAKNVLLATALYAMCRRRPRQVGEFLLRQTARALPPGYDLQTHFKPRYGPWEQRLCLLPDADLFTAIAAGQAEVVTDRIDRFTADGLRLASGRELKAELVVSATGLQLQMAGGAELRVDGRVLHSGQLVSHKGVMYGGVPNLAVTFGYTNASWTLKADLTSAYVCRLLRHMRRRGLQVCTPDDRDTGALRPMTDFSSGYFQRAADLLPRQGSKAPFDLHTNYLRDVLRLRWGRVDDGTLRFAA